MAVNNDEIISQLKAAAEKVFTANLRLFVRPVSCDIEFEGAETLLSTVDFTGSLDGALGLCLSSENAFKIVSKMLDADPNQFTCDVYDGIGEVVNMVAGLLKNGLSLYGHKMQLGIPKTREGVENDFRVPEGFSKVKLNYSGSGISFILMFVYKQAIYES
ncbi:MAG: chemotaxis protein CheX [Candidatus Omnitrophica bacterium]|nr:chemotaxis protein CheX [Candidatus Omnitrophota bacterium]